MILLSATSQVVNGRLVVSDAINEAFRAEVGRAPTAEFTLELGFSVSSILGSGCVLAADWKKDDTEGNVLTLHVTPDRYVRFSWRASGGEELSITSNVKVELNADYYAVVERHRGVMRLYLNDKLVAYRASAVGLVSSYLMLRGAHTEEYTGGMRELWRMRMANRAMYAGNVTRLAFSRGKTNAEDIVPDVWRQFRFENNSLLDEVTEAEILLSGAASVTNGAVTVDTRSADNYADINNVSFDDDENFYIRADFTSLVPPSNHLNQTIMGVWTGNNGWAIIHQGPSVGVVDQRNKITFSYLDRTGVQHVVISASTVSYDEEHTVEIYRINGVITIYIDGIPGTSVNARLGTNAAASGIIRMFRHSQSVSTQYGAGTRRNIQIVKGNVPYRTGRVLPVKPYVRPQYTKEVADSIVLQLGFRRGSRMCEVTDAIMNLSGTAAITKQARLTTAGAASSHGVAPLPKFGQGDFTVEFMCNFSALHTSGVRIGHWSSTGGGADAVWVIHITNNRRVSFGIARSDTVGDWVSVESANGAFNLNQNNHVVVQREAGVATVYLNGIVIAQGELDLPIRKQTMFRTNAANGTDHATGSYWNIRIADRALYTETEEPGAPEYGFIEEVSSTDLITGSGLATLVGLTDGVAQNDDEPWLKIIDPYDGKTKFIPKKSIRHSVSWASLNALALHTGALVAINDKRYLVRTFNGSDPTVAPSGNDLQDPAIAHGSEWNRIMYRIHDAVGESTEGIRFGEWAKYSLDDLGLTVENNGAYVWVREPDGANAYARGNGTIGGYFRTTNTAATTHRGWRPVLELLPDPNGFTIVDFVSGGVVAPESGIIKRGTVTSGYGYTRLGAANSFLELPHDPAFAVGAGDFRFEITFVYRGEFSNYSTKTKPLLAWSTWMAPGQPSNMEFGWHPTVGLYMGIGSFNAAQVNFGGNPPVIGERYAVVFERRNGVLSCYLNGELLGAQDMPQAINVNVTRPILIGQRYGGSNYSVYWNTRMDIEHCWFGTPR